MDKISKSFLGLGILIILFFGQALFVLPDLCNADGQLIVCVANTSRIIVAMLVAISFILCAIYFRNKN
ncbi:MAG: hypothetical protein AAB674_00505 [Patescibacteria group bacterium]